MMKREKKHGTEELLKIGRLFFTVYANKYERHIKMDDLQEIYQNFPEKTNKWTG